MKWQMPFVSRRRYERALAAEQAETLRVKKVKDGWWQRHDAVAGELVATRIVNRCLTEDLTAARERLAEYGVRRTVSDVLEEHDVHRKALAEAIHAGLHLNWQQLIETARGAYEGAAEWRSDYEAEKKRADQLQRRLDDACGLNTSQITDGRLWQHTRADKPKGAVS